MKKLACVLLLICGCSSRPFVSSEPGAAGHADASPGDGVDASSAAYSDAGDLDAASVAAAGQDAADSGHGHGQSADSGAVGNGGASSAADSGAGDAAAAGSFDAATVADGGADTQDAQQPIDAGACDSVIARTLWTASAFSSDTFSLATPDRAIDEQQATRWQSGVPQGSQSPEWFQIDLGQSVHVRRVVLYSATANDQAQALDVVVSSAALALSAAPIASAVSGGSTTTIELDGTGRYLLLKQTGSSTAWWSINDLAVFGCVQ